MGRNARLWIPTSYYHISSRGNRREALFRDENDYLTYFYILQKLHEKYHIELASYCLMTNHFHLLLRSKDTSISKIMALLNKRYATYFNHKYRLTGHLYEKRFFAKHVGTEHGMLEIAKYIHLNPVEAYIVSHPEYYRWSSFCHYMGTATEIYPTYFNFRVIDCFQGSLEEKRVQLWKYTNGACHHPKIVE